MADAAFAIPLTTRDEYLALEEETGERHEFVEPLRLPGFDVTLTLENLYDGVRF